MKKNIKYILVIAIVGILIGTTAILYTFFKPQKNIQKEKPAFIMESVSLHNEFTANEDSSNIKFNNQVIQVSGKVVEFSMENNGASVVFVSSIGGVTCSIDSITMVQDFSKLSKIRVGDSLLLKGRCDGYDMIMGVVLSKCVLL
jgi:hypothetical protein